MSEGLISCSTSVRCGSTLEEALAAIAAAGFRSVDILAIDGWVHVNTSELISEEGLAAEIDRTTRLLRHFDLIPAVVNCGVSPELHDRSAAAISSRKAETAGLMRWMKALGIGIAAVQPRQPDKTRPWEEAMNDCVISLREQLEIARAAGVVLALEFHVNSPFETMEQCRRLMELLPEMPLVYDPTHFVMQGVPLADTFAFMDRAAHVHLRDADAGQMQVRCGQGAVDFEEVLAQLQARGYEGGISIEYLQTDEFDCMEDAVQLRQRLASFL